MYERSGYDWRSLGQLLGDDPIPGSPDEVERSAAAYQSSAANLQRAASNLRRLRSANETCSEAVDAIMAKADAAAGTLEQVRERYDTIAGALRTYAPELRQAQATSIRAVGLASAAARRRDAAHARNEAARWRSVTVDPQVRDEALREYHESKADYEHASGDVESAKALLRTAISQRDAAGAKAASAITADTQNSPLNDTVGDYLSAAWEKISKVVIDVAKWVWDHIDQISLVLNLLSAIFPPLGVLATIANIAAGIKQGLALYRAVETGIKTGNWNDAIKIGISIGLQLLTMKAGVLVDKLGSKASSVVGKLIDKHNLKLIERTGLKSSALQAKVLQNGTPWMQMHNVGLEGRVLSPLKPGSAAIDVLERSANPVIKAQLPELRGAITLMKGTDYQLIKPYVGELTHLAQQAPISPVVRQHVMDLAERGVETAAHKVIGAGEDYVRDHLDEWFPSPGSEDSASPQPGTCTTYRAREVQTR